MSKEPTPAEVASGQQSGKAESRTSLARTLGRSTATLMTAAMIIGTGIFGAIGSATAKAGSGILIAMKHRRSHRTRYRNQRSTTRSELSQGGRSLYLGTRVQPQDSRIHCGLCLSREGNFLPKRHFARVRLLFSPANTGSALTAVCWGCDPY